MVKSKYSRRDFLKVAGVSTLALAFPTIDLLPKNRYKPKIGLQLYTVRIELEKDFNKTIQKISDMGYIGIETYFLPESITLERAGKVFNDAGLKIFAMHADLPIGDKKDLVLKMADSYNSDLVVYHGWPEEEKYKTLDATKKTVELYNEVASFLRTKGLKFGLHNHWWEFEKQNEIYPFYYLLENLDKEIFFEIDTYWAKTGGQNPAMVIKDFGKRVPLLHIKDGPAIKGEKSYEQVPAGEGIMDFPAIVNAGNENIKWMIVEFDEYGKNIFDGIQQSYNYLTKNGLAKGNI